MDVDLRVFPGSDGRFEVFARAALRSLEPGDGPWVLQELLRRRYPAAVVSAQEAAARLVGQTVWYAFRYGSIGGRRGIDWDDPDVAWGIIDNTRTFLDASEGLAAIVEVPVAAIVGRPLEMFTNADDPSAADDILALWAEFRRTGIVESSIRFNYADGRPRELAYRVVANDGGPGRHRLLVCEVS